MTKSVLGIIGGSGIYDLPGLKNAQSKTIESPWGELSSAMFLSIGISCWASNPTLNC